MATGRRRILWTLAFLVGVLVAFHTFWLSALGHALVSADQPEDAGAAVVLAGDYYGNRVLLACDLVRQGFVPFALVSGPSGFYGHHETDLSLPFAVDHGCRPEWLVPVPNDCRSTRDEAALFAAELRRRGVRRCLLVTSNYHTRRAGRLFRAADPGLDIRVIASPDVDFDPDTWWRSRQAMKVFAFESLKTVTGWFGI